MTLFALICLSGIALAGALWAAFRSHVLHAIIGLAFSINGVAGIFIYLGSPYLAAMILFVYIGGISVAMLFAMMLSVSMSRRIHMDPRRVIPAVIVALAFAGSVGPLIAKTSFAEHAGHPESMWKVEQIGHGFLQEYNVAFELLALVLLLAIVAAVAVAKKDETVIEVRDGEDAEGDDPSKFAAALDVPSKAGVGGPVIDARTQKESH